MVKRSLLIFLLFFTFSFFSFPQAQAASSAYYYKKGIIKFHYLLRHPKKAKYRSYWLKTFRLFKKAYYRNPRGSYAVKSLYYMGRVYEEIGKRSGLKKDFVKAKFYFEKVVTLFPKHRWADDAKLREAKIDLYFLKNKKSAYINLLYILSNYSNGDKAKEAKRLLRKLNFTYKRKVKISKKTKLVSSTYRHKRGKKLLDIRYWNSSDYSRVVLDLDSKVRYRHFLLKPTRRKRFPRIVIDLKGVYPSKKISTKTIIDDGLLSKIRSAVFKKGITRVVLDVKNMKNYKVFTLSDPFRIVIDIYGTEKIIKIKNKDVVASSLVEQLGLDIKTIMIDPGHGGKDPGAIWGRLKEKDINLRFAKILGRLLRKKGYKVLYTRTKDVFIPLEERTALANSKKVDLFISIHVNANRVRRVRGLEVYYLNFASSKDAIRVAARENAVSAKRIGDLQVILTELMLNSKIKESATLAKCVLKKVKEKTNGVKEAPFYVLMGAKMPAILIELGYITNPIDRKRLCSYSYLLRLAREISDGIDLYRKNIKRFANLTNTIYP